MTDTVQNNSLTLKLHDGAFMVKVLFVCALALFLLFTIASKAVADPAPATPTQTSTGASLLATATANAAMPTSVQITYDDASCSICHYSDVVLEHQTRGGCTACHKNSDYTADMPSINFAKTAGKAGCGVDNDACHSQKSKDPWHGYDPVEVAAAHATSITTLPTDPSAASCGGYGSTGPNCHATGSTQSNFFFGAMDVASAHADYSNAVTNNLVNHDAAVQVSPVITASASACGLCHDKNSTETDALKPEVAKLVLPAKTNGTFSCLTCHDSKQTYVASDAYPSELQTLYPGQSLCYMTSDAALLAPVTLQPHPLSSTDASTPATSAAPTGQDAATQLNSLLSQLSPDLQAQLSGVTDPQQQQLSAGVLAPQTEGIPLSALPATSISTTTLFK